MRLEHEGRRLQAASISPAPISPAPSSPSPVRHTAPIAFTKIRVENTNACKYTCGMCPREKMTRATGIMPPDDYALVLDRLDDYVTETGLSRPFESLFFLHGYGEPLLDPHLARKAALVAERFPAASSLIITTLGVPRPDAYFEDLLVRGKLKSANVSFYGFQPHTYLALQSGGNFEAARRNLRRLAALNHARGNPCHIVLQLLSPITQKVITEDLAERQAFEALWAELEPLGVKLNGLNLHNFGDGRDYFDPRKDTSVCSVAGGVRRTHLNVSWDLKVLPCCLDYNADIVLGDLRRQSIAEIYHGAAYARFIEAHESRDLSAYPLCQGCDLR